MGKRHGSVFREGREEPRVRAMVREFRCILTLMRRMLAVAVVGLAGLCGQETIFRTGVSLVRIDAQVTDGLRSIDHLEAADFEIKDNGAAQPVLYCSQEDQAMD